MNRLSYYFTSHVNKFKFLISTPLKNNKGHKKYNDMKSIDKYNNIQIDVK